MFCRKCGKELEEDWIICPYCRTKVRNKIDQSTKDSTDKEMCEPYVEEDGNVNNEIRVEGRVDKGIVNRQLDEDRIYILEGRRRNGNRFFFSKVDMYSRIQVRGDKITANIRLGQIVKKYTEFSKSEISNISLKNVPILSASDILRLVVFAICLPFTGGASIFAILYSIYIMFDRQLVIELCNGNKVKIPTCQDSESISLLRELGYPERGLQELEAYKENPDLIKLKEGVNSLVFFLVVVITIKAGIEKISDENTKKFPLEEEILANTYIDDSNEGIKAFFSFNKKGDRALLIVADSDNREYVQFLGNLYDGQYEDYKIIDDENESNMEFSITGSDDGDEIVLVLSDSELTLCFLPVTEEYFLDALDEISEYKIAVAEENSTNPKALSESNNGPGNERAVAERISGEWDKDVRNGLLYGSADGKIVDVDGNIIPEYEYVEVLSDGRLFCYNSVMRSYHVDTMGQVVEGAPDNAEGQNDYGNGIPENPNTGDVVGDAISEKAEEAVNSVADSFMNSLIGWGISMSDEKVDKRNVSMYYGIWKDESTGNTIYISEGKNGNDYSVDLSSLGYDKDIAGTFTSSQTIYMGDIGMGIIMNDDGSIYVDYISITGKEDIGNFVRQ